MIIIILLVSLSPSTLLLLLLLLSLSLLLLHHIVIISIIIITRSLPIPRPNYYSFQQVFPFSLFRISFAFLQFSLLGTVFALRKPLSMNHLACHLEVHSIHGAPIPSSVLHLHGAFASWDLLPEAEPGSKHQLLGWKCWHITTTSLKKHSWLNGNTFGLNEVVSNTHTFLKHILGNWYILSE